MWHPPWETSFSLFRRYTALSVILLEAAALNAFMTSRERAAVVATCRQEEYQELGLAVDKATHIEMLWLNGRESASNLSSQLRGDKEKQAWKPVLTDLRDSPGGLLSDELATPWRLTLALTVFHDGGDPAEAAAPACTRPRRERPWGSTRSG